MARPDVAELTGIGAVVSETSNVIVLAGANLATKRSQVESLFSRRTDEEMEDLVFVPEMKLRRRLEEMGLLELDTRVALTTELRMKTRSELPRRSVRPLGGVVLSVAR